MQVYYATQFVLPLPAGHRFPMAKYQLLRDRLAAEVPQVELMQAVPATDGELALVHTPGYIQAISDGSVDPG
ncbi:MAG TPA: histone deacetylase, partial [Ramlibacter sp.]|nr:histone deacetylase [Ramlibacter sp.]